MREEGNTEGALFAKPQDGGKNKKNKNKKNSEGISTNTTKGKTGHSKKSYPPCKHYATRKVIHHINVGEGLMLNVVNAINLGMKLSFARTMVSKKKQMLKLLRVRRKINSLLLQVFQVDHLVSVG